MPVIELSITFIFKHKIGFSFLIKAGTIFSFLLFETTLVLAQNYDNGAGHHHVNGMLANAPAFAISPGDLIPPIIANVRASNITTSSATINWTTNELCDAQVEYGFTTHYGFSTPINPAPAFSHTMALFNLQPNVTYHYRVKSKDAAGNPAVSDDLTFVTVARRLQFVDITASAGVAGIPEFGGHAILFADVNGDDRLEMYVTHTNFDPNDRSEFLVLPDELFINNGNNTFTERAAAAGVQDPGQSHGAVFVDIDNDGDFDLFNGQRGPSGNRLYRNNGNGNFTDVTSTAGILPADRRTIGVLALDIENDGDMDLFSANWGVANEMYVNDGTGRFTVQDRGVKDIDPDPNGKMAATAIDIDNDGDMDIFYAKRTDQTFDTCKLFINNGQGFFTEQAIARGVAFTGIATGAVFVDFDNDADLDMLLAQLALDIADEPLTKLQVYRNQGSGFFVNETNIHNITMAGYTINAGDLDNDGDADIYLSLNHGEGALWLNDGAGHFVKQISTGLERTADDARAGTLADIDGDGDLDVAVTHIDEPTFLYRNDLNVAEMPAQNYLQIALAGSDASVGKFGSKFYLYEAGHLDDPAYMHGYQELTSSSGTLSQNFPVIHFGVSPAKNYDLRVRLLGGKSLERTNIAPGQRLHLATAPDTAKPIISNVSVNNITSASATIVWTTNEVTDSQVEYGLTSAYGFSTPVEPSRINSHAMRLSGLQASTFYHYRVKSKDAGSNLAVSSDFIFATPAPPRLIFADNFNTAHLDTAKWRLGANLGNRSAVVNNALQLRSSGMETGWVITRNAYAARNTTITLKVTQPNEDGDLGMSPTYDLSANGIFDQANWYRFYVYRNGNQGPYRLYVQWKKNSVENGFDVTGNLLISGALFLRLRLDNSRINFEASLDGVTWVNTYNEIFALPGYTLDSHFYYELAGYRTATNGVLTVDDFIISSEASSKAAEPSSIPQEFALQNYPNPFVATTQIYFTLFQDAEIKLTVFDLMGHEVQELITGLHSAGDYSFIWDGKNRDGNELSQGVYFLRLRYRVEKANEWSQVVRRVMMVK